MTKNHIILIGFMGAGKTTIAKQLSSITKLPIQEMDQLIIDNSNYETINQIFNRKGEIGFRELEIETAKTLSRINKPAIISTGGGVVMNKIIIDYLRESGTIIYLHATLSVITERLSGDTTRPLFKDLEAATKLYKLRQPLYKSYCDLMIDTNHDHPQVIAQNIINQLNHN